MPNATSPELEQESTPEAGVPVSRGRRRVGLGVVIGKRLRRRTRWFFRCFVFLPLLLIFAGLLLMRSPLVGWLASAQLEAALGCEARADVSFVMFDGRIVLRGLSLRVPGMKGPQGEFLHVGRAEIDADWSGVLGGDVKPKGIRLYEPRFRVSADEADSVLNIQALHPSNPAAMSGSKPMRIDVVSGVLELGEHAPGGGAGYRTLREIGVSGALSPDPKQPGVYQVRFYEMRGPGVATPAGGGVGMVLDGRVDLQSSIALMSLLNVDLTAWDAADVPASLRDVWRQLNIKGRIASTSLEYFPTTGLTAVVTLESVSMDAIVPASFTEAGPADDVLSLRQVHGTIKLSRAGIDADVAGLLEDQTFPSRVVLKTRDVTTDAALECKIISRSFKLEKDPTLLPFCPPVVRDRLADFSGPTAVVDADVVIRRDAPGPDGPAPFRVAGWLTLENGVAAFDRVPYPFTGIHGRVEFDDKAIDILGLEGVGSDGATVSARGRIAPPNHDAEVVIEVSVRNVPLDRTFTDSLPPGRAEALDFLFSRERYDELLAAGLVVPPTEAGAPVSGPGGNGVPEFALGGRMDLDIVVRSPRGRNSPWTYDVDVVIPRAGVLTRAFPLPIAARNIHLKLSESRAALVNGEFAGLGGGTTGVEATVILDEHGESVIRPSVTIDAHDIPLDDLLLHAIEHATDADDPAPEGDTVSPSRLLRLLALTGDVDCRAEITSSPDQSIGFDIGVKFDELIARPGRPEEAPVLELADIAGSIQLTNTRFRVPRLTASLRALEGAAHHTDQIAPGADLGWISGSLDAELVGVNTSLLHSDAPRSRASLAGLRATIDVAGAELLAPIEVPVAAFSVSAASQISRLRDARQPSGRVSGQIELARPGADDPIHATARLSAAENLEFDAAGERFETTLRSGAVVLNTGDAGTTASFEKVQAETGIGKAPRALLGFDGVLSLEAGAALDPDALFRISGTAIPIESAGVGLALRHALSPENLAAVTAAKPTGVFDAEVRIPSDFFSREEEPEGRPAPSGLVAEIVPRSLRFDFEGTRVAIDSFEGRVSVRDDSVRVEQLSLQAADWRATIDGAWAAPAGADQPGVFDARLRVAADSLTPGVRALFPAGLRRELDRIELDISGALRSDDAHLTYRPGGPSALTGTLAFADASMDIGAPLSRAHGSLALVAERPGAESPWSFGLDLDADRIVAAGLEMTDMQARLSVGGGNTPGGIVLEHLAADCYAGRVTASARVAPAAPPTDPEPAAADRTRYDAEITMAGVCFAPVLAALEAARSLPDSAEPLPMPTELATDPRRGRLDGTLAISGIAGDASSRSGVGSVRIAGGDVVEMPLVLTLVQLSNFQVALNDRLDFLQAIFHVSHDQVVFDQIDLLSSSIAIAGRGTMSWPEQELDLRFNSRAGRRVPVISDLLEALRDEIATTRIRGTLSDPRVGPEPLTGTRDLIGSMMGEPGPVRRSPGLPDAAAERRRYREQRPHQPSGGGASHGPVRD